MQSANSKTSDVYVISLDAVDLNLLPTIYSTRNDKITPLWAKSNLDRRNNEYYQFEIKTKASEESVKDKSPKLEFENTICYICDIEVPKPFMKEHKKSLRHKTNVQIADVAINRMKSHINSTDNEYHDDDVHPSVYFCPICITVMDCKDRTAHDKSLSHKNAIVIEKIFNDFLMLYHSNEKASNSGNEQHTNVNDLQIQNDHHITNKQSNPTFVQRNIPYPKNVDVEQLNCKKNIENPTKVAVKNDTSENNPKTIQKISRKGNVITKNVEPINKEYISSLNSRVPHPMVFKVLPEELIEIGTIDGSIVKVTENQFHGFVKVAKKIECLLCKNIYKEKIIEIHKISEMHVKNLLLPLKNKNCIRQIDDTFSHCVICNELIQNSDIHSLCNQNHYAFLKDALVSDKLDDTEPKAEQINYKESKSAKVEHTVVTDNNNTVVNDNKNKTSQKSEEVDEPDQNSDVSTKDNEKNLLSNKYFCTACNVYCNIFRKIRHNSTVKHILNTKSNIHYLMIEVDANTLLCRVCGITVKNNVDEAKTHAISNEHIKKYNNLLLRNSIKRCGTGLFYCELCDEITIVKNEIIHLNSKEHQAKLNELKPVTVDNPVKSDTVDKSKSDTIEVKSAEDIDDSKKTIEVTEDTAQSVDESDKIAFEFYHCEVCDVKVPNYHHNINEHMKGRSHCKNLEQHFDDASDTTKEDRVIHYLMEKTEYPNILNCKVCKKHILFRDSSVSLHLIDAKHATNYEQLLVNNCLVMKSNDIFCDICKVSVGLNSELIHINGRKHIRNLQKRETGLMQGVIPTNSPAIDENMKKVEELNNVDKPSTSNSNIFKPNPPIKPDMLIYLKPSDHPKEVICRVCEVKIPYTDYNVSSHMNGGKHKTVYNNLLAEHGLEVKEEDKM